MDITDTKLVEKSEIAGIGEYQLQPSLQVFIQQIILKAQIVVQALVKKSVSTILGEDHPDIEYIGEILGPERKERLSELQKICEIMSSFDPTTLTSQNYPQLLYQLQEGEASIKRRELISTSKIETLKIIAKLRDFNFWHTFYTQSLPVNLTIEKNKTGFFIQEMAIESAIEKWLQDEFKTETENLNNHELIPELAKYLYDRLIDPTLDQESCLKNYSEDYWIWAILGNHNNEIALALEVQQEMDSSNIDNMVSETFYDKKSESSVKQSIAIAFKTLRENSAKDIDDIFRSTIKIDGLFDGINHLAIITKAYNDGGSIEERQKIYDDLLKDTRMQIMAIYLKSILQQLSEAGYEVGINNVQQLSEAGYEVGIYIGSIKSTITGYSDITLKIRDAKGRVYEIQLQTEATLNNKAQETIENDLRKEYLTQIYGENEGFIKSFPGDSFDHKNLIQDLIILENGDLEEFSKKASGKISSYLNKNGVELNSLNQQNLLTLINAVHSIKNSYEESIARSRIIYKLASFLSTKQDFDKLMDLLGSEYANIFRNKITEIDPARFNNIDPKFTEVSDPAIRMIVVVKDKAGNIRLLFVKKTGTRAPGNITTLGGSVQPLSNIINGDGMEEWHKEVNNFFINGAISSELENVLGSTSGASFSVVPLTTDGKLISYSVLNPTDEIARLKLTYPQMVVIEVDSLGDFTIDPNHNENFEERPVFMTFEEFMQTMIACNYKGSNYNASLAQTPTSVLLAFYTKYQELKNNELKLEFKDLPLTANKEQKIMETNRSVVYRVNPDNGQREYLMLQNNPIQEEKKYNYLPQNFDDWEKLDIKEKLKLVDPAMIDYLNNKNTYEKFINASGGKITTYKKNISATFSPKKGGSLEFPGGKKEDLETNTSALKEFMEETGLYITQQMLQEEYKQNNLSEKNDNELNSKLTTIGLIISKIETFYFQYPKNKIQVREGLNKDRSPKKIYYYNFNLNEVLGTDLVKLFAEFVLVNTTMNREGKPDDNHSHFIFVTQEEYLQMLYEQKLENVLISDNPIVDHSKLPYKLRSELGLI